MIALASLTVAVASGLGNHIYLLQPQQVINAIEWSWIGQSLVIQTIGCGKYAVIAFILRIQDRTQSRKTTFVTHLLYFIGYSNFVINITEMAMILTSCSPTAKFWNSALPGSCNHIGRTTNVGYFQGCMKHTYLQNEFVSLIRLIAWTATSDLVLAAIPVYVFWDLRISAKLKIGLCLLMAGGTLWVLSLAFPVVPKKLMNESYSTAVAGYFKTVYIKTVSVESDTTCNRPWLSFVLFTGANRAS